MENEVVITRDKTNERLTFQAKGDIDFLESITATVLSEFNDNTINHNSNFVKGYDALNGYIGETVNIAKSDEDVPNHYLTGIKTFEDGSKKYKCRYICSDCGTKENKYLTKYSEYTYCRKCNHRMYVKWVDDEYEEEKDTYNNFAYAGKFKPIFK